METISGRVDAAVSSPGRTVVACVFLIYFLFIFGDNLGDLWGCAARSCMEKKKNVGQNSLT